MKNKIPDYTIAPNGFVRQITPSLPVMTLNEFLAHAKPIKTEEDGNEEDTEARRPSGGN